MPSLFISREDHRIRRLKSRDERLAQVVDRIGDLFLDDYSDGYRFLVFRIIGQMISDRAARAICERFEELCGGEVIPSVVANLPESELLEVGLSRPKSAYVSGVTELVLTGELNLNELPSLSDEEVEARLTAVKGVGSWTAQMYLMCALQRENVLPENDRVIQTTAAWLYGLDDLNSKELKERGEIWSPYRSFAAFYLYRASEFGFVSVPFVEWAARWNQTVAPDAR